MRVANHILRGVRIWRCGDQFELDTTGLRASCASTARHMNCDRAIEYKPNSSFQLKCSGSLAGFYTLHALATSSSCQIIRYFLRQLDRVLQMAVRIKTQAYLVVIGAMVLPSILCRQHLMVSTTTGHSDLEQLAQPGTVCQWAEVSHRVWWKRTIAAPSTPAG
jgi:hypothetical protein